MVKTKQHDSAVQWLEAGLVEQDRSTERYDAAVGTSSELSAYVRLRAAGAEVAARAAWLHWIDDESYRGLNAGPFELPAETPGLRLYKSAPKGMPEQHKAGPRRT